MTGRGLAVFLEQLLGLLFFVMAHAGWADSIGNSRIGELTFDSGYPAEASAQKLHDEFDFQRAVQAYLWAMPVVSDAAASEARLAKGAINLLW